MLYNGEEDIVIEYIFRISKEPSDVLIVMLPGQGGGLAGGD